MIKFLPNIITIFRIILVPFFIYFLINDFVHSKLYATIIFGIASISDIIDGKIARKYGIVTRFGTFMDPLADKILVVSALLVFVFFKYIPLWMVIIIISRDILITLLRLFMEHNGKTMITSKFGKFKTMVQITSINLILLYLITLSYNVQIIIRMYNEFSIIYTFMLLTTLFTFITGFDYFYKNHKSIKVIILKNE